MKVKTKDGGIKDVALTEVTAQNYIVPDNEKHLYHCIIEVRKFDSETGRRLSVPRLQKFGKKTFETNISFNLKRQGYTIVVLHNPTEYLAEVEKMKQENAAKAAAEKAEKEAAEKEAAEKELQAKIDAAVKQALEAQAAEYEKAKAEESKTKK